MAKWPTKKLKYVDIKLYKQRVWFTDNREVFKECRDAMLCDDGLNLNSFDGISTAWRNTYTGKMTRLVGIFKPSGAVLAHECSHVVMDIFNHLGIIISADQQEPFCYLLEYLFGEAAKKLGI